MVGALLIVAACAESSTPGDHDAGALRAHDAAEGGSSGGRSNAGASGGLPDGGTGGSRAGAGTGGTSGRDAPACPASTWSVPLWSNQRDSFEGVVTVIGLSHERPDTLRLFAVEGTPDLDAGTDSDVLELSVDGQGLGLPDDLFARGDTLEISYTSELVLYWSDESIIITRMGELVLFVGHRSGGSVGDATLWPELERFDVAIRAAPTGCLELGDFGCEFVRHDLLVSRGGEAASRSAQGNLQVGDLSMTGRAYERILGGNCDAPSFRLSVIGFVAPAAKEE